MGFDIPFIDLPDLPANPEQFIKDRVIELLNYLGYPWPTTEPGPLRTAGSAWTGLKGTVDGWIGELEGGIKHLSANNAGPTADVVLGQLQAGDSNLASLKSLSAAIPTIASGYGLAADVVIALRIAVVAEILLDELDIRDRFACVVGAGTLPVSKPDPRPYQAAVEGAGGAVARSFLVGDTETDVKTARAAGVRVALVGFGPEGPGIERLGPDYLLHDFAGLPDLAQRWLGANAAARRKA